MTTAEVATLINAIADSLAKDPAQFHFSVIVAGVSSTVSGGGGIGVNVSAQGGAPGSRTVGMRVTAGGGNVEIGRAQAQQAGAEALADLHDVLRELATTVEQPRDEGKISTLLAKLRGNAVVPGMVLDTVETSLKLAQVVHSIT